ncbi:TetR/AcrR family transcriptional regulator [Tsukamurella sp. 8F]|uniref:TetR/AcrR family transcriptional regulator n=1 Tax=unclassified Tsukamurella TaxID=2633480 RepID=UPI0023BA2C17|nr:MULTISPECIES: TetR/AcrR family transcriptional regulator [unclassified Tsukamurella]MDF0529693.1 TetR/AcrR family transcriptional regulator [Tsukamurella sp. 8J]MDF0585978.1 TetR/AcrR family transcriptional regulator [Tsukamurella sp. 8F]
MRPPDPRTVRSRETALAAARELLIERGLAGLTHTAVAARSGISRATLYRLWPETPDLVCDTVTRHVDLTRPRPTGDLRDDLLAALTEVRAMLHEPAIEQGMRVVIERAAVDPKYAEVKESLYRSGTSAVRAVLTDAIARGALPRDVDVDSAIDCLHGPLFFRRLLAGRRFELDYVRIVVERFLQADHTKSTHQQGD